MWSICLNGSKKDPERLAHEFYYTPYARQVYEDAFSAVPEDSLEKAVNFYISLNMGHGFRTNGEKGEEPGADESTGEKLASDEPEPGEDAGEDEKQEAEPQQEEADTEQEEKPESEEDEEKKK